MTCPECGSATKVVETVPYPDRVRRRRECRECGKRFTTDERRRSGNQQGEESNG